MYSPFCYSPAAFMHSNQIIGYLNEQAVREAATICPRAVQVDLWPWKWCPSHACWRGVYLYANASMFST